MSKVINLSSRREAVGPNDVDLTVWAENMSITQVKDLPGPFVPLAIASIQEVCELMSFQNGYHADLESYPAVDAAIENRISEITEELVDALIEIGVATCEECGFVHDGDHLFLVDASGLE